MKTGKQNAEFHRRVMALPSSGQSTTGGSNKRGLELKAIPKFAAKQAPPILRRFVIRKCREKYEGQTEEWRNARHSVGQPLDPQPYKGSDSQKDTVPAARLVQAAQKGRPLFIPLNKGKGWSEGMGGGPCIGHPTPLTHPVRVGKPLTRRPKMGNPGAKGWVPPTPPMPSLPILTLKDVALPTYPEFLG